MDITPIYELRTRLKTAVIAGTNLLAEDFRLKRAVEAIQPLLPASPVFAKIGQLCAALLKPEPDGKEGLLLDAITLVDAVLCTQGAVAVRGELEPVMVGNYGTAITNAPYSLVKSLLDALTNSGNGRYSHVVDTHSQRPELFNDYRVKAAMVQALDAPYAELAAKVEEWLSEDGESVVPLLKNGFDPKGKKGMVRRVQVMDAVAGERENDFYLAMLPEAEKEVRQALIYALRRDEGNLERLIGMIKTEKGTAKKTVYYALAMRDEPEAAEAFETLMQKKPLDAVSYLEISDRDWASELVARGLKELLLPWAGKTAAEDELTANQAELLIQYMAALPYKRGESIRECYKVAVSVGSGLEKAVEKHYKNLSLQKSISHALYRSLLIAPDKKLTEFAIKLYAEVEGTGLEADYFQPAFVAKLLTEEDCCSWLRSQMAKRTLLRKKVQASVISGLEQVLSGLCYEEERGEYVLYGSGSLVHPVSAKVYSAVQPVKQRIPGEFTELLMELGSQKLDNILNLLKKPDDTEYRERLCEYYYKRALTVGDNRMYCRYLTENGGRKCEGLAVHYFRSKNVVERWDVTIIASYLPGDGKAKAEEIGRVFELIKSGKLKKRNITDEWMKKFIEDMA